LRGKGVEGGEVALRILSSRECVVPKEKEKEGGERKDSIRFSMRSLAQGGVEEAIGAIDVFTRIS